MRTNLSQSCGVLCLFSFPSEPLSNCAPLQYPPDKPSGHPPCPAQQAVVYRQAGWFRWWARALAPRPRSARWRSFARTTLRWRRTLGFQIPMVLPHRTALPLIPQMALRRYKWPQVNSPGNADVFVNIVYGVKFQCASCAHQWVSHGPAVFSATATPTWSHVVVGAFENKDLNDLKRNRYDICMQWLRHQTALPRFAIMGEMGKQMRQPYSRPEMCAASQVSLQDTAPMAEAFA